MGYQTNFKAAICTKQALTYHFVTDLTSKLQFGDFLTLSNTMKVYILLPLLGSSSISLRALDDIAKGVLSTHFHFSYERYSMVEFRAPWWPQHSITWMNSSQAHQGWSLRWRCTPGLLPDQNQSTRELVAFFKRNSISSNISVFFLFDSFMSTQA